MTATSSVSTTTNPLLQQDGLPKFAEIEPSNVTPAVQELLAKLEADFAKLETDLGSRSSISYDDVLPRIERIQHGLEYAWGVTGHLNGVKNSDDLRKAYEENQPEIVKIFSKFKQSKVLYDALNQIQQEELKEDETSFEMKQRRRAVQNSLRAMKLGGVGLTGEAKERFNEIKQRLAAIATTFSNNVLDETKAFSITITDKTQLEGVPDSAKAMWAQAHVAELKKQNPTEEMVMDPENGPWRITLDMPSYIAVLSHVRDRTIRETVYRANIQRASEQNEAKNNIPLIYEILQLRQEMAELLGFSNYAELSLASKMAPTIESVRELSDLIRDKALPAAEKELAEITALAQTTSPELKKLEPWDITFWSERLKESKFDLTEEETRPYFALPAVLDGMFALVRRLFGVRVEAADGEAQVWHPDVRFFKIYDGEDTHIASFYLDPYSRPENKRGGAWMDTCLGKSAAVGIDVPVAYLTCNGSPPVGTTPSLMTFREVETLFHEFGHGLQHMLTKANVGDVAGINGIEWDAVELPSQFMENWCYDRPTIYGFAKHWETGEPMPEDMFQKLCQQKTYNAGMMACRQLLFGQLDMELHSNYDAVKGKNGEGESIFDVHRRMAEKYTPYNLPLPEDRFLCAFSHIFAGGYAAGYYR
jgi:oligopeptidase A